MYAPPWERPPLAPVPCAGTWKLMKLKIEEGSVNQVMSVSTLTLTAISRLGQTDARSIASRSRARRPQSACRQRLSRQCQSEFSFQFSPRCLGSCGKLCVCDKPWVSGFTSKEATASCGRLVMLLDHVFMRDVTVSTSTRTERKSRHSRHKGTVAGR